MAGSGYHGPVQSRSPWCPHSSAPCSMHARASPRYPLPYQYAVPAVSVGTYLGDRYMRGRQKLHGRRGPPPAAATVSIHGPCLERYTDGLDMPGRRRAKAPLAITAIPITNPPSLRLLRPSFFRNFQWTPLYPRRTPSAHSLSALRNLDEQVPSPRSPSGSHLISSPYIFSLSVRPGPPPARLFS